MPDGILAFISAVGGGLMTALTLAFRAGERNKEVATKDDLKHYVTLAAFTEFKSDLKSDLDEIKKRQDRSEERSERRHDQVVTILTGSKE